jgi:uncharacterized membrane protein
MNAADIGYLIGAVIGGLLLPMGVIVAGRRAKNKVLVYGSAVALALICTLVPALNSDAVELNLAACAIVLLLIAHSYWRASIKG